MVEIWHADADAAGARAIVPLKGKGDSVSDGYTGTLTIGMNA